MPTNARAWPPTSGSAATHPSATCYSTRCASRRRRTRGCSRCIAFAADRRCTCLPSPTQTRRSCAMVIDVSLSTGGDMAAGRARYALDSPIARYMAIACPASFARSTGLTTASASVRRQCDATS
eukprot:6195310-Pleurochrysis_carterae.AAC.2